MPLIILVPYTEEGRYWITPVSFLPQPVYHTSHPLLIYIRTLQPAVLWHNPAKVPVQFAGMACNCSILTWASNNCTSTKPRAHDLQNSMMFWLMNTLRQVAHKLNGTDPNHSMASKLSSLGLSHLRSIYILKAGVKCAMLKVISYIYTFRFDQASREDTLKM